MIKLIFWKQRKFSFLGADGIYFWQYEAADMDYHFKGLKFKEFFRLGTSFSISFGFVHLRCYELIIPIICVFLVPTPVLLRGTQLF